MKKNYNLVKRKSLRQQFQTQKNHQQFHDNSTNQQQQQIYDNLTKQQQIHDKSKNDDISSDLMKKLVNNVKTDISPSLETKMRYFINQRLGLITNGDELLSRGNQQFNISEDISTGSKSFLFKTNGVVVAKITSDGILYVKNIRMNGLNILDLCQKVVNDINTGNDNYVKHSDLKGGDYEMNIKKIIAVDGDMSELTADTIQVGHNEGTRNNALITFNYVDDESTNNSLEFKLRGLSTTPLKIDSDYIQMNFTPLITTSTLRMLSDDYVHDLFLGLATSSGMSAYIQYSHNMNADNRHLQLGIYGSNGLWISKNSLINYHKTIIKEAKNSNVLELTSNQQISINGDYLRTLFTDGTGQAVIDFFHDTQYYGIKFKVLTDNSDDSKLCIYPTGVGIDGLLDCYDDVSMWENLEVNKSIQANSLTLTQANAEYSGSFLNIRYYQGDCRINKPLIVKENTYEVVGRFYVPTSMSSAKLVVGHGVSGHNSLMIKHYQSDNYDNETYATIGFPDTDMINLYYNAGNHYVDITTPMTIHANVSRLLNLLNSSIANDSTIQVIIGKDTAYVGNLAKIQFVYVADQDYSNNYLALGMAYYSPDNERALRIYYNKVNIKQPLYVDALIYQNGTNQVLDNSWIWKYGDNWGVLVNTDSSGVDHVGQYL